MLNEKKRAKVRIGVDMGALFVVETCCISDYEAGSPPMSFYRNGEKFAWGPSPSDLVCRMLLSIVKSVPACVIDCFDVMMQCLFLASGKDWRIRNLSTNEVVRLGEYGFGYPLLNSVWDAVEKDTRLSLMMNHVSFIHLVLGFPDPIFKKEFWNAIIATIGCPIEFTTIDGDGGSLVKFIGCMLMGFIN